MRSFIARYQFLIFVVLAFLISWIPWYSGGYGLFTWGPSLAGLLTALIVGGGRGVVDLLRRLVRWQVKWSWWMIAILLPVVLTLVALGVHVLSGGNPPSFKLLRENPGSLFLVVMILLSPMGGAGGEETFGWRNYAQAQMQRRWSPLATSFWIGIFWSAWHLPEFFNPNSTQYAAGIGFLAPMTLMWIALSILMTWIYNNSRGSALIAGVVFHLSLDVSSMTLLTDFTMQGMVDGIPALDLRLVGMQIAAFVMMALLIIIQTKARLGIQSDLAGE